MYVINQSKPHWLQNLLLDHYIYVALVVSANPAQKSYYLSENSSRWCAIRVLLIKYYNIDTKTHAYVLKKKPPKIKLVLWPFADQWAELIDGEIHAIEVGEAVASLDIFDTELYVTVSIGFVVL